MLHRRPDSTSRHASYVEVDRLSMHLVQLLVPKFGQPYRAVLQGSRLARQVEFERLSIHLVQLLGRKFGRPDRTVLWGSRIAS